MRSVAILLCVSAVFLLTGDTFSRNRAGAAEKSANQKEPYGQSLSTASGAHPASESTTPTGQPYRPFIPQTWDDLRSFDVPLADRAHSPEEVSWDYYYRVPWRAICGPR